MKKKYFTAEEKRIAKNLQQKKYYEKIKKTPLTNKEKKIIIEQKKERRKKYVKEYYIKNKQKIKKYSKEYFIKNKEKKLKKNNENSKKRKKVDPLYKLTIDIRRSIRCVIKNNGFIKKSRTFQILSCSYLEFKQHIESQFEPWMNWENHGKYNGTLNYGWDIDHIIPISSANT